MNVQHINAADAPVAMGGYSQAVQVDGASRLLFISGQIPVGVDGQVPANFEDQAALAWKNVGAQLRAAGMTFDNLVKVTIFLSDRRYSLPNRAARKAAIGERKMAMTVVMAGIFDETWLLEIEAVAAA